MKDIVFARMPEEEMNIVRDVCKSRGEGISNFVRRAVLSELARLSYLSTERKKALGLSQFDGRSHE
jgi:hypothetical protein